MKNAGGSNQIPRIVRAITLGALAGLGSSARSAQLPVPCIASSCGPKGPQAFVTSGSATAVQAGNTLTVQQNSAKTILNWSQFNVSADGKVVFNQPTATSIALNRIFDANPSTILGQLNANGQVYLINPNGFVFGSTARVNTSGLIAASLGISDNTFNSGLLAPQLITNKQAALTDDPTVVTANGNAQIDSNGNAILGDVTVEQGAQITATSGGRVLLAAPNVQNAGTIQVPDGQIVLAAGRRVYLQASGSSDLRGLVVEVDSGGKAANQLAGSLTAARGNITLVGLAVNQDGRISATTTVAENGSIRLEAGDTAQNFTAQIQSSNGGTVELGPQSSTSVLPELSDTSTAVPAQTQLQSEVTILGQAVYMHGGSITAPNGILTVVAAANPGSGTATGLTDGNSNARIRIDPGTSIDLSGSSAELPMSDNLVTLQLRGNELADDPTQRNGALRGTTVTVDSRVGTPIANVQAAVDAVPQNIAQRTEKGGSATFLSEGDVVVAQGASINVSGGKSVYDGGVIQTTQLIGANGKLYDIGTANPLTSYTGVLNPTFTQTFNKWGVQDVVPTPGLSHYASGYTRGAAAGSITFAAPNMVLNGTLAGHAVNGPYQRGNPVQGGQLIIGLATGLPGNQNTTDYLSPPIVFSSQVVPTIVDDNAPLLATTLHLPTDYLVNGGFTGTTIYDNTRVTLPAGVPLDLIPGSTMSISAPRIDVMSNITDLGGTLNFQSVTTLDAQTPDILRTGISIGNGVTLDVRGQWTNDSPSALQLATLSPTLQNGGTIKLDLNEPLAGELVIGDGVSLLASGGAWVSSSNKLTYGKGGTIELGAAALGSALQVGSGVQLEAFGVGNATGGTFTLTAPRLSISNGSAWASPQRVDDSSDPTSVFNVYSSLFRDYGFSTVNLGASGLLTSASSPADALTVTSGTTIAPFTRTLQLSGGYLSRTSGGTLTGFSQEVTPTVYAAQPETISLSVVPGTTAPANFNPTLGTKDIGLLDVQTGASITADVGSTITLAGAGGVYVNGTLRAPAGTITLETLRPQQAYPIDTGYIADLNIELGANTVLDASGAVKTTPSDLGLRLGSVLTGGTVNLFADRGSVITDPGSLIDISGTQASLDVRGVAPFGEYSLETMASAGGALNVHAPESITLLGNMRAAAGVGNPGQPAAGSLEVDLTRSLSWFSPGTDAITPGTFPQTPRVISIVSSNIGAQPTEGSALLGAQQIQSSGFDSLQLEAGDRLGAADTSSVNIATSTPIVLGRQISLDAPVISVGQGVNASLSAPYLFLGNSQTAANEQTSATGGDGSLSLSGQLIDLSGSVVLQGVGTATLISGTPSVAGQGDIRLLGANGQPGALQMVGNLTLDAARIYPGTGISFSITASGAGNSITIGQTSASPGVPLSAGGQITLNADNISSSGTLLAPFGTIDLNAATSLTLADGSVTSVSAGSTVIPYGNTILGGTQWVYGQQINGVPTRQVVLSGASVTIDSNATVDLRGGGDLYAYEWVPGTGGSTDALLNGQIPNLYAVIPSMRGQSAPYDPQMWAGSSLAPGASVYLAGGGGLAAGVYPLLRARYGLLPGAILVQYEQSFQGVLPGQQTALSNGTPVVAGYFTFGNTGINTGINPGLYSGFAVFPSTYARSIAGYQDSYASTFFNVPSSSSGVVPTLPADAGRLSIDVGNTLNLLGGQVLTAASGTGRAAEIDISGLQLEVTVGGASAAAGHVGIASSVIQGWGAGELVLGGRPSLDNTEIAVTADSVTIDSGVQLSADQVILTANQSIDLKSGSSIASTSGKSGIAPSATPIASMVSLTGADAGGAALFSVSDDALILAQPSASAGTPPAATGVVTFEAGATVATRGALSIDAPGGATLSGTANVAGASVSLSAPSIGLLAQTQADQAGDALQINGTLLGALAQASELQLTSQGAIDIYAPLALGASSASASPTFNSLTLVGSVINNKGGGNVVLGGQTLTLGGVQAAGSQTPVAGSGTLDLVANEFDLAPGNLAITGFGATNIHASGAVVGNGTSALVVGGDLAIAAGELTASAGSNSSISAPNGNLTISEAPVNGAAPTLPTYLGGSLTLAANAINDNGTINVQSGLLNLRATQDLSVGGNAVLNAGGTLVSVVGQTVGSAGGAISLSAGGNIDAAAGSVINVAGAGDAAAGTVAMTGAGTVTLQGKLVGNGGNGAVGGSFSLQGGQLGTDLDTLASAVQSGAFTQQISIQVHSGDLDLGAGNPLTANQVTLSTDTGTVKIDGSISASAAGQRGQIGVYGGQGVLLDSGGQLHADGSASNERGGHIDLGTGTGGQVSLASGSVVTAAGSEQAGTLLIRAPATSGGDVAISQLNANVTGVGQVVIEPVMQFTAGPTFGASDFSTVQSTVGTYMATAATSISSRLNPTGSMPLVVQAGVELDATGDLTLTDALDLSQVRFGGQPIDLTMRSSGSILVQNGISDGVTPILTAARHPTVALGSDASSSIRLVAGANLSSANPLAIAAGSQADLTLGDTSLGTSAIVRTGTGELDLLAARDVVFNAGSAAYTTGLPAGSVIKVPKSDGVFNFPQDGGTLFVSAGRDVIGSPVSQSITDWQIRQGNTSSSKPEPVQWGVDLGKFDWNLGTLGGGDLTVFAGGNILNLSAAAANSRVANVGGNPVQFNSGGLRVDAGGDVGSGQFYAADGLATLTAGGAFSAIRQVPGNNGSIGYVGALIALNDAQVSLQARLDVDIDAVVNPTSLVQPTPSLGGSNAEKFLQSDYFTYDGNSKLAIQSTAGSIVLNTNDNNLNALMGSEVANNFGGSGGEIYPSTFIARSLQQDVIFTGTGPTLFASTNGQFELLAGRDVSDPNGTANIVMSDASIDSLPTPANPQGGQPPGQTILPAFSSGAHISDTAPALVTAGRDVSNLTLSLPKAAQITAGRDIIDLNYNGQNLNSNDLTLISAGRDFVDTFAATNVGVNVGGPGRLDVLAGRDVNLGFSAGITTVGNFVNPNLTTSQGADLTVFAGLGQGANFSGFLTSIIEPSATYQQDVVQYMQTLTGQAGLSQSQADSAFAALSPDQQRPLIDQVFFDELTVSGREANTVPGAGFARGYAAIDALFPNSRTGVTSAPDPYKGDLTMTFSRLYTISGGSISLFAPGGAVNVGLAVVPPGITQKDASKLGIVAEGTGNVDIYSKGDVLVNASRIFTLGGGNILIWSDEGNIDAGRGSKSSISVPPPVVGFDALGNVTVNLSTAVAGSGIRTIQIDPAVPPGNVDLIAPVGSVNAGDAGIGAAGNLNIAAQQVIGLDNIQFGGTATGVPAQVSNLGASLSGVSAVASSATNSATSSADEETRRKEAAAPLTEAAISWLDVFVTGLGEENCKTDDVDCLKRQRTNLN